MVSLYDITVGREMEFRRVMATAGFTGDFVNAILCRPALANELVEWLRGKLAVDFDFFVPLDTQLANITRWNDERSWGFPTSDFKFIDLTPVNHPGLTVDMLTVYLPQRPQMVSVHMSSVQRTFEECKAVAFTQRPKADTGPHEEFASGPNRLRLIDGRWQHRPGIYRVTIDLGANWGLSSDPTPNQVRSRRPAASEVRSPRSAASEVLMAAAHFPDWVRAMDGFRVPYVFLPGYELTVDEMRPWTQVPCLYNEPGAAWFTLGFDPADRATRNFACPVLL